MQKKELIFCLGIFLFISCRKETIEPLIEKSCYISKETFPNFFFSTEPDTTISFDSIPCEYVEYAYNDNKKLEKRIMYRQLGIPVAPNYYYRELTRTVLDSII
jgi:hypothetical protein